MDRESISLDISWDVLDACNGFSLDMGGSVLKLVYINKAEWREPGKRENNSKGKVHLVTFSHKEFHDGYVYKFIKQNALLKPGNNKKPPIIYCTGFWASTNGAEIDKELGVSLKCLAETDGFVYALSYAITNLPRCQVVDNIPEEVVQATHSLMKTITKSFSGRDRTSKMMRMNQSEELSLDPYFDLGARDEPFRNDADIFPYILVMCGSAAATMCVYEDGKYTITTNSTRSGKTWLGMGSLLTGSDNYETIMQLATNGSITEVDMTYVDFVNIDEDAKLDDDNVYQKHRDILQKMKKEEPMTAFAFGKAVEKKIEDFKKEDLANTYLKALTGDMASHVCASANFNNAKHVFFSGGLVSHPLVRRYIYIQLLMQNLRKRSIGQNVKPIQCHFLKGGQHYGALGALLNHKYNFFTSSVEQ